jgi:hypothetical protein
MSLTPNGDPGGLTSLAQVHGEIVHAIPGRVRVRVPHLKWNPTYTNQLEQQIRSLAWISSIQVNSAAACLTLTYDKVQFPNSMPSPEMLMTIQQVSGLMVASEKPNSTSQSGVTSLSEPLNLLQFNLQATQIHLKTVGGGLIGAVAGDIVGGAVGATAGAIMLGPPGAIVGGQIGIFVGGVVGAQIGAETVHQVDQLTQLTSSQPGEVTPQKIAETIQKRAAEKIGEMAGQAIGGIMGKVVLGPPGQIVGAIVGGTIGGQLGQDTVSTPKTIAVTPSVQPTQNSLTENPYWLAKTTQKFISETAVATMGGAVGRLVLGPTGQPHFQNY